MPNIEVYTKPDCSYCNLTKTFLEGNSIPFKEYKIGADVTRDEVVAKFPNARTVPIILLDSEHIGGYNELIEHITKR
jgi:thioredoxin reductase (NADPH)